MEQFGARQARRCRNGFEACFATLAERLLIDRSAEALAPNLRRFEHRSRIVFYIPDDHGVLIVRVLQENMDAARHL